MTGQRFRRVREEMQATNTDVVLLSLGADLPWLTGYEAMALERLTMLVLPKDDQPTLIVPKLEAPRVRPAYEFKIRPWEETEDPIEIVCDLVGTASRLAISDRTWSVFLLALQRRLDRATFFASSELFAGIRAVKDAVEIEYLQAVAAAADRVADQLLNGDIDLIGRSEAEVSADISARLRAEGHSRVNFAIVAAGDNSASPHHEPSSRIIGAGEAVVCDFGGTMNHYCSDITRTVFTGEPSNKQREVYEVVRIAQDAAMRAAVVGASAEQVDAAAREVITDAGYGRWFIHRTGHGIGVEEHEPPYLVVGNADRLVNGNVFSIEPGIYLPSEFGIRIEDIVVATESGPRALNRADHSLQIVE